jgi:hypothetical protein
MPHYCKECGNKYINKYFEWCRTCQIKTLKNYTTISDNEIIDNFIQEMQLKIDSYDDIVFEWIQYSQFNNIKEIGKNEYITLYSAVWKDGPLNYNVSKYEYIRNQNEVVTLKYLINYQNIMDTFLKKV